jgi:hypothetical protein
VIEVGGKVERAISLRRGRPFCLGHGDAPFVQRMCAVRLSFIVRGCQVERDAE